MVVIFLFTFTYIIIYLFIFSALESVACAGESRYDTRGVKGLSLLLLLRLFPLIVVTRSSARSDPTSNNCADPCPDMCAFVRVGVGVCGRDLARGRWPVGVEQEAGSIPEGEHDRTGSISWSTHLAVFQFTPLPLPPPPPSPDNHPPFSRLPTTITATITSTPLIFHRHHYTTTTFV